MVSQTNGEVNGHDSKRPDGANRNQTAPSIMTMNSHFANVGDAPTKEQFGHGIQVIDEEKTFRYAAARPAAATLLTALQLHT